MKFILDICIEKAKFLYVVFIILPAKRLRSTWYIHWGFWKISELQGTQIYLIFSYEVCGIMHLPFVSVSMKREYNGVFTNDPYHSHQSFVIKYRFDKRVITTQLLRIKHMWIYFQLSFRHQCLRLNPNVKGINFIVKCHYETDGMICDTLHLSVSSIGKRKKYRLVFSTIFSLNLPFYWCFFWFWISLIDN